MAPAAAGPPSRPATAQTPGRAPTPATRPAGPRPPAPASSSRAPAGQTSAPSCTSVNISATRTAGAAARSAPRTPPPAATSARTPTAPSPEQEPQPQRRHHRRRGRHRNIHPAHRHQVPEPRPSQLTAGGGWQRPGQPEHRRQHEAPRSISACRRLTRFPQPGDCHPIQSPTPPASHSWDTSTPASHPLQVPGHRGPPGPEISGESPYLLPFRQRAARGIKPTNASVARSPPAKLRLATSSMRRTRPHHRQPDDPLAAGKRLLRPRRQPAMNPSTEPQSRRRAPRLRNRHDPPKDRHPRQRGRQAQHHPRRVSGRPEPEPDRGTCGKREGKKQGRHARDSPP